MPLVDDEALDALSEIAEDGMQTPVEVHRADATVDPETGQSGSNELGDDVEEYIEGQTDDQRSAAVWVGMGWFHSNLQTQVTDADGQVATVDIHELRLPRAADIKAGDEVVNLKTGDWYLVVDTNDGDTYRVQTRATLRRREG